MRLIFQVSESFQCEDARIISLFGRSFHQCKCHFFIEIFLAEIGILSLFWYKYSKALMGYLTFLDSI